MTNSIMVGMAEVKICHTPEGVLTALGLGSCIGVCALDPVAHVTGMAHIVLPKSMGGDTTLGKFADTGVPLLLQEMEKRGARSSRIRFALVGGAQLFSFQGANTRLDVGVRNIQAVQAELAERRLNVVAEDVGGKSGRTVYLNMEGVVRVRVVGQNEYELVNLAQNSERTFRPLAKVA